LAEQIKKSGTPPTKVTVDATLYTGPLLGPAWDPDEHEKGFTSRIIPLMIDGGRTDVKDRVMPFDRYDDPDLAAGKALARLLGVPEESVTRGQAAPNAAELGAVKSAPVLRQLEQMLAESDNTLAEAMARQVALARNKPASFEGGAAATEEVLAELGLPKDQMHLVDGAGYSRQNQLSPAVLTGILKLAADGKHPQIADVINALPVAGWNGSMAARFGESDAVAGRGVVRAKSGTLTGINAISGVVQTADGGLYAFSVLADQVPTWQIPAQVALDRIVAKIAACGCG
jgi:D-alanyl-D-alanine carboxypeptidase/D-alanyl-D-alanine-endopeptidase (penicillin-binding protein 4)